VRFPRLRRGAVRLLQGFNWVLVISFVVGLELQRWFPSGLGYSFGEALLIASILGATVDWYLKRRILREASADISKFLLGYSLPRDIQDQIRNLMQTSLLRRGFEIRYEILRLGADRCKLNVDASFLLENFTNKPQPYTQSLAFEAEENPQIKELRLDSSDTKARYCLREGDRLTVQRTGGVKATGPGLKIGPLAWGKTYRFGYRYSIEFPSSYPDILSFDTITSGVVVRIIAPADLEVVAGVDDTCDVSPDRYEYKRVFLPGQHIRIRWKPRA
jgi:hypothetical protein